jgi:predicted ribosome quality control (RQC) complex YloA/Tae2 family protein
VKAPSGPREYRVRELPGEGRFNRRIDDFYAEQGGALSLESLREEARRDHERRSGRLRASLEKLRAKEADFSAPERLREYGDLILSHIASIRPGDEWFEPPEPPEGVLLGGAAGELSASQMKAPLGLRIRLDPKKSPAANAGLYYTQYRKAKSGLEELRAEIASGEAELERLEGRMERLLGETNPLVLHRLLRRESGPPGGAPGDGAKGGAGGAQKKASRVPPGLRFRRGDWLILVGRNGAENDALLRRHVKGNDLWLHVRDFPGSYVFVKQRAGKTVPLEILLDAGNLALFYSRGRNNGEADLFYTPVKYLRRAKDGPRGLVLPTQEKNLHIKTDEKRLRELETCKVV